MTSSSVTAESKFLGHVYHAAHHQEVSEPGELGGRAINNEDEKGSYDDDD